MPPAVKARGAQNVKGRIRHLEQLVLNLMDSRDAQTNGTTSPPWSDTRTSKADTRTATALPSAQTRDGKEFQMPPAIQLTPPYADSPVNHAATMAEPAADAGLGAFGQMKITKNQTSYVGDSHWVAILHSIDELKRDLDTEDEQSPTSSAEEEPLQEERSGTSSFLLGSPRRVTKAELLQSLPDKAVMDGLLSQWFNAPDPFKPIVHAPTFQEEYRQFCRNPGQTPVMWIGVLFAIMSLATSFTLRSDLDKATLDEQAALVDKYHEMAAAAAVLGGFTRPKAHTLECLILYAGGLRSMSAYMDIWLVLGLVVRLALRMGYHRDPSHYPNISPFEGEIRRRTWFVIYMADVLISFQLGLPSMIRTISSDTQVPRNLMDSDFNVNTVELPPSRPVEQLTPGSYGIAKVRICRVFATAAENSHDTVPPSYPEVIKLDAQLEKARALIPPPLQFRPLEECITDSPELLMCRLNLDLLYHKTKIVIHRRHMRSRKVGPEMPYSRQACITSAMRILYHHHAIFAASQAGGQLNSVSWYMGSISTHDFLLAAMIICLELSQQIYEDPPNRGRECPRQRGLIEALERSQRIWGQPYEDTERTRPALHNAAFVQAGVAHETKMAAKALAVMLRKIEGMWRRQEQSVVGADGSGAECLNESRPLDGDTLALDAAWSDLNSTTFDLNPNLSIPPHDLPSNDFPLIGDMLDVPDDIDWGTWDYQISGQAGQEFPLYNEWPLSENRPGGGIAVEDLMR